MKINILIYFLLSFLLFVGAACTDKFEEYNTDKTKMMEITDKELAGLFTRAQITGVCWLTGDQYGRATRHWANSSSGYYTTSGASMEQMSFTTEHIETVFTRFYSQSIPAIGAIMGHSEERNPAAYHLAAIWKAFVMYQLADAWGPIPYTEAGSGKDVVPYESLKDIYYNIFRDVSAAVNFLTAEVQKNPDFNVFGMGDIIYKGKIALWIKFANTMRLRLAVRISNIDPDKAKAEAEAAVKGATMDSNEDNAWIVDLPSFNNVENGLARVNTGYSNVMSASMESFLKGYNDPRLPIYFSPVENQGLTSAPPEILSNVGGYHGLMAGYSNSDYVYYRLYSRPGPMWVGKNVVTTEVPINIKFSSETYFLKAEGAWRGWNMGGTAEEFYKKGIELSLTQWLKGITTANVNAYIQGTTPPVAPDCFPYTDPATTDIPVKFSADKNKQFEQIITQKWLALYPDSWEAWAEYRRTRLPKIYLKKNTSNEDIDVSKGQIVTRLIYPENEKVSQPYEVKKAVEMLGGPDKYSTSLWWDVNKNGN